MPLDIAVVDCFDERLDYVSVVAFVGENVVISFQEGKGALFPIDAPLAQETPEEALSRLLFDQVGASPLVSGVLAIETVSSSFGGGASQKIGYFWSVLDGFSSADASDSMAVYAAKCVSEKQLRDMPFVQERKLLYDAALPYAKIIAEKISKATS